MSKRSSPLSLALSLAALLVAAPAFGQDTKKAETKPVEAAKAADAKPADAAAKPTDAKAADAKKAADPKPVVDGKPGAGTIVEVKTSEGTIKLELADKEAPVTVKNFVAYANDKFYDGTIFHRVIDGFMIQGGGFTAEGDKLNEKPTKAPIVNEAKNGLKNDRGTIAMARTSDPNSATAQFFINHANNNNLDHPSFDGHGYAVFGKVTEGLDVVDKIAKIKTGVKAGMRDVPVTDVKIVSVTVLKGAGH